MRHSKEDKEKALLRESEEWEQRKRGKESVAATTEEEIQSDHKLELQMISLRLPSDAVTELKRKATQKGLGYQPYIRQVLMEHIQGPSLEDRVRVLERKMLRSR